MTTIREKLSGRLRSSTLRKRIRSSNTYWRIKVFLKRLIGKEIWIRTDVRLDASGSCEYCYDASRLRKDSIVYSFGVGDSIDFERELIDRFGVAVHTFDPTPYTLDWINTIELPEQLIFYPWAVAGEDGELQMYPRAKDGGKRSQVMWTTDKKQADAKSAVSVPAYSIGSLLSRLGHSSLDLIKMDIEGGEYEVLSSMLDSKIYPNQILVEFHHRFPGIGKQATIDILKELRANGYRVFWVSRTGLEVGLVKTD